MRHLKLLIFSFLLLSTQLSHAQTDFKPGYVIKKNGDTLSGKIDYRGDRLMNKVCRFKPRYTDTVINYRPRDLQEFRFENSKYYVSKELETGNVVFVEYLLRGELNVYYYRDHDMKDHYLIDKEDFPLKAVPYREEIKFKEDVSGHMNAEFTPVAFALEQDRSFDLLAHALTLTLRMDL